MSTVTVKYIDDTTEQWEVISGGDSNSPNVAKFYLADDGGAVLIPMNNVKFIEVLS